MPKPFKLIIILGTMGAKGAPTLVRSRQLRLRVSAKFAIPYDAMNGELIHGDPDDIG
jgi:hypothetical protein